MARDHDVIVVGGGPCGLLAAKLLTDAACDVLLLEAGPDTRTWRSAGVMRQPIQSLCWRCAEDFAELFVDDEHHPYVTDDDEPYLWIRGRQIGGRALAWSGVAVRLTDADFKPALPGHPGWPIRYSDLARYYRVAEEALDVRGACVVDEKTSRYISSYDGPWPASARHFKACVESVWPDRQVLYRPTSPTAPNSWRDVLDQQPLLRLLETAERSGHLTLRCHTTATSVAVDRETGLAAGVAACDSNTGEPVAFRSSVVVICASTIESTRLLLGSRSARHPAGLGNRSGLLGRYLTDHASGIAVTGRRRAGDDGADYYDPLLIPRYRNVTTPANGFVGGYWWQGYATRDTRRGGAYDYLHLSAFGEVRPRAENHVRLSDGKHDALGVPLAHISFSLSDNERRMAADIVATGREMLQAAGFDVFRVVDTYNPNGLSAHEVGTARMGTDPQSSVVNSRNQLWDCENVYVTDGSAFVSSGSINPTLTMLALTARACDHILAGLRRRDACASRLLPA